MNDAGTALNKNLTAVEETLYQTKNQSNQDPLNYPIRLNNKLAALGGVVGSAEAAPTAQSYAVYDELVTQIDAQLQSWRRSCERMCRRSINSCAIRIFRRSWLNRKQDHKRHK